MTPELEAKIPQIQAICARYPVARLSAFGSPCLTNPYIKKSVEVTKLVIYATSPMSNLQ